MGKGINKTGRGGARFVMLPFYLLESEAWVTMPPGPRALYVALKKRFTGTNNGEIILSHRQAARELCVHRNSITAYYAVLLERGFIKMAQGPHLGPSGVGVATLWALEEATLWGQPAGRAFLRWLPEPETRGSGKVTRLVLRPSKKVA